MNRAVFLPLANGFGLAFAVVSCVAAILLVWMIRRDCLLKSSRKRQNRSFDGCELPITMLTGVAKVKVEMQVVTDSFWTIAMRCVLVVSLSRTLFFLVDPFFLDETWPPALLGLTHGVACAPR